MRAAVFNDVPGIVAECGGAGACATCHVYIEEAFLNVVNGPTPAEQPLLEFVEGARTTSRLSCQIQITPELEGMSVETPESQY
jgi:ferredoxin, 2Fe-2S